MIVGIDIGAEQLARSAVTVGLHGDAAATTGALEPALERSEPAVDRRSPRPRRRALAVGVLMPPPRGRSA